MPGGKVDKTRSSSPMIEEETGTLFAHVLEIKLSASDKHHLDACRGDLPPEEFIVALIRLAGSNRFSAKPVWIKTLGSKF